MRFSSILCSVALLATVAPAQKDGPILLTEPKSGVSVMLPKNWAFMAAENGLIAASEDKKAMIVLAETMQKFGQAKPDVKGSMAKSNLSEVKIDRAVLVAEDNRGALEGLIQVSGSGIDKENQRVDFSALITKSGDKAGLALGAWKTPEHRKVIRMVLDSISVRNPKMSGGLELTETKTGASVTVPEGWVTMASRKGLLAYSKDRNAMTLIIRPQDDFEKAVKNARMFLRERVFDKVEIGEFDDVQAVDAAHGKQFARLVEASGKAVDRADSQAVQFRVLAAQGQNTKNGALILGAWKNEKAEAAVQKMLNSIHFAKIEKKGEMKKDKMKKGDGYKNKK